jgi:hypothetical protein
MTMNGKPSLPLSSPPASSAADAETVSARFVEVMDALVGVVRQETALVRAGKLGQATQLAEAKAELTRRYFADAALLRASQELLARSMPDRLEALRQRHAEFRSLLQISLTVLATAHAVSEGIVRGVSSEIARKGVPQTYGVSGRPNLPARHTGPALAVSRSL